MSSKHRNTKADKKALKALRKFKEGNFGADDGSVRPKKSLTWLRKAVIKTDLTDTYLQDKNSL